MAPTIGVNLRVTGHCNQGGRKYMEDAFVVAYQQTEDEKDLEYAYFGIFDGHGGREAALFAKENLMDYVVNQPGFWSKNDQMVLRAIKEGFIATHLAMWKEVGKWPKTISGLPSTSGTTASVAFIRNGKMYIGHVGDSKIVLGYQDPDSDMWLPQSLTKDHKPEAPAEKARIYSVGGLVMNKAGVERVVWKRPRIGHRGPIRRSTHFDQIPFLAVARSLGDLWSYNYFHQQFAVSPEPDVCVISLDPKRDRCIILASDGLWNMVTPRDAVHHVQETERENERLILESGHNLTMNKPANNPSKLLVDRALNRWYNLKMRADNTSVVTVMLDPPGPPKSEVLLRQRVMQKLRPRDEQEGESLTANEAEAATKRSFGDQPSTADKGPGATPKEKKRTSENVCDLRSSSLPKPVVLSPKRVVVKKSHHSSESESSTHRLQSDPALPSGRTSPSPTCPSKVSHQCRCRQGSSMLSNVAKDVDSNKEQPAKQDFTRLKDYARALLTGSKVPNVNQSPPQESDSQSTSSPDYPQLHTIVSAHLKLLRSLPQLPLASSSDESMSTGEKPPEEHCADTEITSGVSQLGKPTDVGETDTSEHKRTDGECDAKRKFPSEDVFCDQPLASKYLRLHHREQSWTSSVIASCGVSSADDLPSSARSRLRVRKAKA